jgi:putative CocE/NonD family hydrolase
MGTAFSDQPYMGGTFVQGIAFYSFWMLDKAILPGRSWTDIFRHRPLADIDDYATGEDIPLWNMFFEHWRNDAFWKLQDWYEDDNERNFGTLQISGWFDDDYPGTRSNWALMAARGSRPNRLLLGPWKHDYNVDRMLNGYSFGVDAVRDDIWLIKQKWFDYFLKDIENGVADLTVEYFVIGENKWRTASAWPPEEATAQRFYFHSTGRANSHPSDGRLTPEAPTTNEPPEVYEYNPKDPVTNWYSFDLMESWADVQSFPYDFKDIESRHDVATYTTVPLDEDLTLAGNISIVLYASTNAKDTDWWVHLSDVTPSNESNRLTVGVLRARFRNLDDTEYHVFGSNFEKEVLLSGNMDDVVRYEIAIPSVANTFKKGHRVRVAVMNALDNYSFPNSNTGGDEGYVTETVIGNMKIHHSPDYPTHVILPILVD